LEAHVIGADGPELWQIFFDGYIMENYQDLLERHAGL
jgi:hypothetical protein